MSLKTEPYPNTFTRMLNINNKYKDKYSLNEVEKIIKDVVKNCVPKIVTEILEQQKIDPELDLLSRNEVSKILNVSYPTLHNYKHNKKLIPIKRNGKVYYKKQDIKNYLNGKEAQNDR